MSDNQKQNRVALMANKKYKLSFFGASPRTDWTIVLGLFLVLLAVLSAWFYFDRKNLEESLNDGGAAEAAESTFSVEKARQLIDEIENKNAIIDQNL